MCVAACHGGAELRGRDAHLRQHLRQTPVVRAAPLRRALPRRPLLRRLPRSDSVFANPVCVSAKPQSVGNNDRPSFPAAAAARIVWAFALIQQPSEWFRTAKNRFKQPDGILPQARECACGHLQKEVPCCEGLRCQRKCSNVRNCGRHGCRRRCCDGDCPPCQEVALSRLPPCRAIPAANR